MASQMSNDMDRNAFKPRKILQSAPRGHFGERVCLVWARNAGPGRGARA
jgi:hypothetical protein